MSRLLWIVVLGFLSLSYESGASDFVVYSVYRPLNLGNPQENPEKDYYVSMGYKHGVHDGTTLVVFHKKPSFDSLSEQLYRDVTFPIGTLKVIHTEAFSSVARLKRIYPEDQSPTVSPRAIMIGDAVRIWEQADLASSNQQAEAKAKSRTQIVSTPGSIVLKSDAPSVKR